MQTNVNNVYHGLIIDHTYYYPVCDSKARLLCTMCCCCALSKYHMYFETFKWFSDKNCN